MGQKPISKERLEELFKLFEKGEMMQGLVSKTGICDETITKYLNQKYPNGRRRQIVLKNLKKRIYPVEEKHWLWKGGREITKQGYIRIWIHRKRHLEHRYVMEQFLGRKLLKHESVHHIDGNKQNNKIENLKVIETGEHTKLHNKNMKIIRNRKGQFKTVVPK